MLIDPRPYTYEFRKPRFGNPTYQSRNLYQSLYHRYPYQSNDYFTANQRNMYASAQKLPKKQMTSRQQKPISRYASEVKNQKSNSGYYQTNQQTPLANNPEKQMQGYKLPSIHRPSQKSEKQYARVERQTRETPDYSHQPRSDHISQRKGGFERFRVYERQQKPYNIISCYPRQNDNNKLRQFPKLTLEDKLIERGSYHDFKTQRF